MPPTLVVRPRTLVAFALACACPLASAAGDVPVDPWEGALRFEFGPAVKELARLHDRSPDDPRVALGLASALLGVQPRTQANILEARSLLERVVATPPADSTFTLAARLLLGRIAEDHLIPSRPDEAKELYEALLRDHAGHPLADQAAVHLALLAAYPPADVPRPSSAELHARIDELRATVRTPEVLRELHALQGTLLIAENNLAAALPHLRAARAVGYRQPNRESEADLSIANIARELGERSVALEHYRAFLAARPRDARGTTVRRYVKELESADASNPGPDRP